MTHEHDSAGPQLTANGPQPDTLRRSAGPRRSGGRRSRPGRVARAWRWLAIAILGPAGLVVASPALRTQALAQATAGAPSAAGSQTTSIRVDGRKAGDPFQGVGAISGGGGNSRYLIDYPAAQSSQILDYLFKPDYGASLQMLKLEIGGDSNSSDGSEPSIEHTRGVVNCNAGYEWWIAEQAVRRNPAIKLYGLQWSAPGWTANSHGKLWTKADVHYVIHWLDCAKKHGLTISYLGGRDEAGYNAQWYEWMRQALNRHGYRRVQIVAADETGAHHWGVAKALARNHKFNAAVSIVGDHDACGPQQYKCATTTTARSLHKPLWLAENPGLNPSTQASNEVRTINRMYINGRMTALFEWPLLDSMPEGLPHQGVGLVTTQQPWTGFYTVNKLAWATAQTTQFVSPGWRYVRGADVLLGDSGSADTYMSPNRSAWSMVAENTGSSPGQTINPQTIHVKVTGGLKAKTVHVWETNLASANPADWFVKAADITLVHRKFSYTIPPDYVVTFTTTTGQTRAASRPAAVPRAAGLGLPYLNPLSSDDGSDEPPLLAPLDGSFGLVPCLNLPGASTCVEQLTPAKPVLWHSKNVDYPYAILGDINWADYTVSVQALMTQPTGTAGVIGRFSERGARIYTPVGNAIGCFKGYLLDVTESGVWQILRNSVTSRKPTVLAQGQLPAPLGVDTWHVLSLSMRGDQISAAIDGQSLGSTVTDATYANGMVGIEAGAFTGRWPMDQYRNLSVTSLP